MTLAAWLHDLDPVLLPISGSVAIYWYGVSYIVGFALAYLLLRALVARGMTTLDAQAVGDMVVWGGIGGVIGGRLGYVLLYRPGLLAEFSAAPPFWGAIDITRGGMASHGGFVGAVAGLALLARALRARARREDTPRLAAPPAHLLDLAAFVAPVGLFCGRIANFVNGELLGSVVAPFGRPAPWWAVRYPQEVTSRWHELSPEQHAAAAEAVGMSYLELATPEGMERFFTAYGALLDRLRDGAPEAARLLEGALNARHPSQLYQAFAEGVLLWIAMAIVWARPRVAGVLAAWFMIVYGLGRVATEFFRLPDAHFQVARPLGLSRGQWLSVGLVVVGAAVLVWITRRAGAGSPRYGGWLGGSPGRSALAGSAEPGDAQGHARAQGDQAR